jgi:hypothetical protein
MSPRTSLGGEAGARRPLPFPLPTLPPIPLRVHPLWLLARLELQLLLLAPEAPDELVPAQLELQLLLLAPGAPDRLELAADVGRCRAVFDDVRQWGLNRRWNRLWGRFRDWRVATVAVKSWRRALACCSALRNLLVIGKIPCK